MRHIRIEPYCDRCLLRDGSLVPGETTPPIRVPGSTRPKTLELCKACREELFDDLVGLLDECGETPEPERHRIESRRPEQDEKWECPFCDSMITRKSAAGHLRTSHHAGAIVQPTKCPDCEFGTGSQQGMRAHRTGTHRYDILVDYIAAVQARQRVRQDA